MSSTNKTTNLKLNDWVGTDVPQREDFNADNQRIDKAIGDHTGNTTVHITQAERDLWLTTTKAPRSYQEARFTADSWLFFGKETAGLPLALRERYRDRCVRLPMVSEARSLNLSNTVAVCVYEALRQNGFPGLLGTGEMAWG